jgi:hypothetical protein
MNDTAMVQQALVDRDWFSVPVLSAHRTIIEFHFEADDAGWSRYRIWGNDQILPNIIETTWTYVVHEEQLLVTWDDGTLAAIQYRLLFENRTAYGIGRETTYDAVLRVASHLFPASSAFPDGWLKDYWGRPREEARDEG